jgi:hypothetical protein
MRAPAGASIMPAPSPDAERSKGPGVHRSPCVTITGFDDFETIQTVDEVNNAPVLDPIGNNNADRSPPATDADLPANTLTFSLDAGAPAGASITAGGAFTWTPSEAQGPGVHPVTVRVTDNAALDDFETIQITVNDLPTITDIPDQVITEDGTTGLLPFTVGDGETPATSLAVTGASSNTTLVPNLNISFGGSGTNRTVTVIPAANQSGTATITVTVTDADLGTAFDAFLVTVNPLNDNPTITNITGKSIDEDDSTGAIAFTIGDLESAPEVLVASGTSSNQTLVPDGNILFSGSGASRNVTVTPAPNQNGTATITVTITDPQGGSGSDTFLLTVNLTNDLPSNILLSNTTAPEMQPAGRWSAP